MTERENFFAIARRKDYERMPIQFNLCPYLQQTCGEKIRALQEETGFAFSPAVSARGLPVRETDTRRFLGYYPDLKPGASIDVFGVAREPGSEAAMHMTHMRHPLEHMETLEEMQAYPFPEFAADAATRAAVLEENAALRASDKIVQGDMQCTIWETAWYMRGMENLMMDMMEESPLAEYLLDRVTEMAVARAEFFAQTGADALFLGDDIGMQRSIMMSVPLYCTWLKPRLKRVIDAARVFKPDILVLYHSCGYVEPFIPHLMEAGVDVLDPVQPECMDFAKIHAEYGDVLSFHGTLGTQSTMPFGSPQDVRDVVFRNLDIAGAKGGLFVCPTHMVEPEVPWENIRAYILACHEYTK